jgi:hypothetical protein
MRDPTQVALFVLPGHMLVLVPLVLAVVLLLNDWVVTPHVVTVDPALTLVIVPLVMVGTPYTNDTVLPTVWVLLVVLLLL